MRGTRNGECRMNNIRLRPLGWIFAILIFLPSTVSGQPQTAEEKVTLLLQQEKLLKMYRKLDYEATDLLYLQSMALLSTYGGWNSVGGNNNDTYRLHDRQRVAIGTATQIGRALERNRSILADDAKRMEDALAGFREMIESAGDTIRDAT